MLDIRKNFQIKAMTLVKGKDDAPTSGRAITLKLSCSAWVGEIIDLLSDAHDADEFTEHIWPNDELLFRSVKNIESDVSIKNLSLKIHIGSGKKVVDECHIQKLEKISYSFDYTKGQVDVSFNINVDGYEDSVYTDWHKAKNDETLVNMRIIENESDSEPDGQQTLT